MDTQARRGSPAPDQVGDAVDQLGQLPQLVEEARQDVADAADVPAARDIGTTEGNGRRPGAGVGVGWCVPLVKHTWWEQARHAW